MADFTLTSATRFVDHPPFGVGREIGELLAYARQAGQALRFRDDFQLVTMTGLYRINGAKGLSQSKPRSISPDNNVFREVISQGIDAA